MANRRITGPRRGRGCGCCSYHRPRPPPVRRNARAQKKKLEAQLVAAMNNGFGIGIGTCFGITEGFAKVLNKKDYANGGTHSGRDFPAVLARGLAVNARKQPVAAPRPVLPIHRGPRRRPIRYRGPNINRRSAYFLRSNAPSSPPIQPQGSGSTTFQLKPATLLAPSTSPVQAKSSNAPGFLSSIASDTKK